VPVGTRHANPVLDSQKYEVEFDDGSIAVYTANIIAENMAAQTDDEHQPHTMFDGIMDHRVAPGNAPTTYVDKHGVSQPRMSSGWELCVQWTNGTTSWLPLRDLKDSNPIETAEYAVAKGLDQEPAFRWRVKTTLRKRYWWVMKVKTRYWKRTHKYGIELPKSVFKALAIDARTSTTFWRDAIVKYMKKRHASFSIP
jgi:hypothetical protein